MPAFRRSKTRAKSLALARKTQQQAAAAYGSLHRMFSMVSSAAAAGRAGVGDWAARPCQGLCAWWIAALIIREWMLVMCTWWVSLYQCAALDKVWAFWFFFFFFFFGWGGGWGCLVVCAACCWAPANGYFLCLSEKGLSDDPDFDKRWDGFKMILQENLEISTLLILTSFNHFPGFWEIVWDCRKNMEKLRTPIKEWLRNIKQQYTDGRKIHEPSVLKSDSIRIGT